MTGRFRIESLFLYQVFNYFVDTDVGDSLCWRQVLEDVDRLEILLTDFSPFFRHIEKSRQYNSVTHIFKLSLSLIKSPTSLQLIFTFSQSEVLSPILYLKISLKNQLFSQLFQVQNI